jgi:hypothetical protein
MGHPAPQAILDPYAAPVSRATCSAVRTVAQDAVPAHAALPLGVQPKPGHRPVRATDAGVITTGGAARTPADRAQAAQFAARG